MVVEEDSPAEPSVNLEETSTPSIKEDPQRVSARGRVGSTSKHASEQRPPAPSGVLSAYRAATPPAAKAEAGSSAASHTVLETKPASAYVFVSGQLVGITPYTHSCAATPLDLKIAKTGFVTTTVRLDSSSCGRNRYVVLQPELAAPAVNPAPQARKRLKKRRPDKKRRSKSPSKIEWAD
jgi:hypothetical protein